MGTSPADLNVLAEELLAACVEALDSIPSFEATLEGSPERFFVSPGSPALDCCDQLSVHVAGVTQLPPTPHTHKDSSRKNIVTLVVTATRCVHGLKDDGQPPDATDLEADAAQMNADGWALWNHLWNLMRSGDLLTLCDEVFWDGLRALTPSGGCGGWVLTLRVAYEGYED